MEQKIITRGEAIELGLINYFTGEPCKNGHIAQRNVKNRKCLACARISAKKSLMTEKGRETRRKYNASEKSKAARKRYRQSEKGKAARKRYIDRVNSRIDRKREAALNESNA